jgi:hypothetical protein
MKCAVCPSVRTADRNSAEMGDFIVSAWTLLLKVKVKQSHYRPWQALRVPGGWGSQISKQSAHEGPTHRPPLLHRKCSWYSFLLRGWVDPRAIVRPEGLYQWKIQSRHIPVCSAVPQPLRHRVPRIYDGISWNSRSEVIAKYTIPNKRLRKLSTSTQLRETWHTDSLDMAVLPSTGASRYHNCCIDSGTSPESFGCTLV